MTLYVLKLQQGKYYVGRTDKPIEERYEEHQRGIGSAWTHKYPPVCILRTVKTSDSYRETAETVKCMNEYGIENVRGGSYSRMTLTNEDHNAINKMIRSSSDQCLRCGRNGHFINDCYATADAHGSTIIDDSDDDDTGNNNLQCFRCGRTGHLVSSCYATTNVDGSKINCNGNNNSSSNAYERDDTSDSDDEEQSEDDSDDDDNDDDDDDYY